MFGVEVDLDDNEAVRDTVVAWAQKQLTQNFRWGAKVDLAFITVVLEDLLRQDLHKGPLNLVEEVEHYKAGQAATKDYEKMVQAAAPPPNRSPRRSVRA